DPSGPGGGMFGPSGGSGGIVLGGRTFATVQGGVSGSGSNRNLVNFPVRAVEATPFHDARITAFNDLNPYASADEFTATIDLGDGSALTDGSVVRVNGLFYVQGDHTYALPGTYDVHTAIYERGGSPQFGNQGPIVSLTKALVADAPLTAAGTTFQATEQTAT